MTPRLGRFAQLGAVVIAVLASMSVGGRPPAFDPGPTTQVGFTFTPWAARYAGLDPDTALDILLDRLEPDLVRLPVYWSDVAPARGQFDFSTVDAMLDRVQAYDAQASRPARVVLVVGLRNVGFPELWPPRWALSEVDNGVATLATTSDFARYVASTVTRYAGSPLLAAWQVENEPLDDVDSGYTGHAQLSLDAVRNERDLVHAGDPRHPVIVTSYNSATADLDELGMSPFVNLYRPLPLPQPVGHPLDAMNTGDILGLDVYVVTVNTSLAEDAALKRIVWKRDILDYWSKLAVDSGKTMWVTEMQAAPWNGVDGYDTTGLLQSASAYYDRGAAAVLLYGVESWFANPQWLAAGERAVHIMRGEEAPLPLP